MASAAKHHDKLAPNNHDDLPTMEERTLFLGCLTHIVASSYDYNLTMEGSSVGNTSSSSLDREDSMFLDEEETVVFRAHSADDEQLFDDPSKAKQQQQQQQQQQKRQHKMTAKEEEAQRARNALIKEKMKLAEQRHLVRRYKVAKDFVESSARHLLLDDSSTITVHKDFLPRLDALLEPPDKKQPTKFSWAKIRQLLESPEQNAQQQRDKLCHSRKESLDWVRGNDTLQGYLTRLNDQAAYQCLSCLLFQHLLHSENSGYDARVRFWFKTLAVTLWIQQMDRTNVSESMESNDDNNNKTTRSRLELATRKFEALESYCADRLIALAAGANSKGAATPELASQKRTSLGRTIWKGVQIGSVGVGAGLLLAVTGGLAAPGIAFGLAAIGLGSVAWTFLMLASSAAVVTLFGVAGGSLAAYKMTRRVSGLTEFIIHQELLAPAEAIHDNNNSSSKPKETETSAPTRRAQLFRTVCLSGWVHDKSDFQRPWGVTPTKPPIKDPVELLQRFYYIHNPELVEYAEDIYKKQNKERNKLWKLLRDKYGCDPDNIFGKEESTDAMVPEGDLTDDEKDQVDRIIVAIGNQEGGDKASKQKQKGNSTKSSTKAANAETGVGVVKDKNGTDKNRATSLLRGWGSSTKEADADTTDDPDHKAIDFEIVQKRGDNDKPFNSPAHLKTVWDYSKRYGGELYTVQWESDLLRELSDSIRDLAFELATTAGRQIMKTTIVSYLIFAAALPMTVISIMNSIDETWTLVMDRADEAGQELARSLLVNKAGHRPVTLVGYSFGARIIYVCLKELAQYQQKWEDYQNEKLAQEAEGRGPPDVKRDNKGKAAKDVCKVGSLEFDREPASIVEDVILLGMPEYLNLRVWKACRQVVAGRLVNVYSRKDKVLAYVFKYRNLMGSYKPVVGNGTVAVPGVENIDVTDMVSSHEDYSTMVGQILQRVRHGQPVRVSSYALDEVALLEVAQNLAESEGKDV